MLMRHYLLKMRLDSNQITFGFIQEWRIKWQQIKLSLFSVCYSLCVLACVRVCVYICMFVCLYVWVHLQRNVSTCDAHILRWLLSIDRNHWQYSNRMCFFFIFGFNCHWTLNRNAKGWIQSTNRISFGKGKACALPKNTDTHQQAKCFGK